MTERVWLPPWASGPEFDQDDEGYVRLKVDRARPDPSAYAVKPKDLLLAMARMSRDGMTREQIRRETGAYYHVAPNGVRHYIDDATFDRALERGRALLDAEVRKWHQTGGQEGEPPETVHHVLVPKEEDD